MDYVKENKDEPKTLVEIHRELVRKAAVTEADAEENETSETEKVTKAEQPSSKSKKSSKRRERKRKRKEEKSKGKKKSKRSSNNSSSSSSSDADSSSEDDEESKKKKELKKALKEEEHRQANAEKMMDDRNRPYNSRYDVKAPTEAETEAYQIKRLREEDPMLQFMKKKK
jgi:pre-mRNA-processing factor SLU7